MHIINKSRKCTFTEESTIFSLQEAFEDTKGVIRIRISYILDPE